MKLKKLVGCIIGFISIPWGIYLSYYLNSLGANFFVSWLCPTINILCLYFYGLKLIRESSTNETKQKGGKTNGR